MNGYIEVWCDESAVLEKRVDGRTWREPRWVVSREDWSHGSAWRQWGLPHRHMDRTLSHHADLAAAEGAGRAVAEREGIDCVIHDGSRTLHVWNGNTRTA